MTTPETGPEHGHETVAVVVVTMNRADLLAGMLAGLAAQTRRPDVVVVVDNASTDHTLDVLAAHAAGPDPLPLDVVEQKTNTGGAGGFHAGVRRAYDGGWDRIWLMDDDVVPAPDCLATLMATDGDCLMSVREDREGRLVEKAAVRFDLANPLAIRPKTASVETTYGTREAMPPLVELENVAFEGYLVRRRVVDAIGLPDPTYFIFYDDVDWAIRARRAGFTIRAVRDAVLVRQLDFNQQHDLSGWKGFYMYRNLFVVHLRYGENVLVRLKPWMIVLVVVLLSPVRGGRGEAVNVTRAIRAARGMRRLPGSAAPAR
jgi:rhamnopyranosyl-N-acetylglucosaminyl-diphospho-decaprenol beta-1,3/1,4-galactofuranosyltransferase